MVAATGSKKLFDELCRLIHSGVLTVGMALPSEHELCMRYAISRPTVRRALDKLCSMNLVEKRPGIGTFVTDPNQEQKDFMHGTFRVGSIHLFGNSPHYAPLIIDGMTHSPYGRNFYLKPLNARALSEGIIDADIDALFLDSWPEPGEKLLTYHKPVVICNRPSPHREVGSIRVDHYREARRGVDYLIRCGHRRIALIGGCMEPAHVSALRTRGYFDAFDRADIPAPEDLQLYDSGRVTPSEEDICGFIREKQFDAAFFINGAHFQQFVPYYNILSGRRIDDLGCLVFDNIEPLKELASIPCAYIKMPLEKFGSLALDYMRRKAHDTAATVLDEVLPCEMVVRY